MRRRPRRSVAWWRMGKRSPGVRTRVDEQHDRERRSGNEEGVEAELEQLRVFATLSARSYSPDGINSHP